MQSTTDLAPRAEPDAIVRSAGYRAYVLFVILIANIFNYADRAILSVLAEPIKRDLHVSDAQLGFLYGTSFILLNGLAALAVARIADNWLRHRLLAVGLICWTGMTALSGLATNLFQLTAARLGIGLGEATLSPIGHSLLADLFTARARARAFSVYMLGSFLGSALCVSVAGALLAAWPAHCGALGACGLKGWQAAFLAIGLPGLLVSMLVLGIGEPARDIARRRQGRPVAMGVEEISMLIPPFSLFRLAKLGGASAIRSNMVAAIAIVVLALALIWATGDILQWTAIAFTGYCAVSWAQGLQRREPDLYRRTLGSRAFVLILLGVAPPSIIAATVGFWGIPLAVRTFGLEPHEATGLFGLALGGGALVGTLIGGAAGDWVRGRSATGVIWILQAGALGQILGFIGMLLSPNVDVYAGALAFISAAGALWAAPSAALIQEMLLPSMRARGATIYALALAILALSLGPYTVGRVADATGSLAIGLAIPFILAPIGMALLFWAMRVVPGTLRALEAERA